MYYTVSWLIFVTVFFTPLLFSPVSRLPFGTISTVFFRIMVEILVFLVLLYFVEKKKSLSFRALFKNPTVLFFSLFIFVLFLATIFSISPVTSFFGGAYRLQGFFTFIHYFLFFFIILFWAVENNKSPKKKWFLERLLWTISLSGFITSLFAILQKIQLDPFAKYFESQFLLGRVYGTLGHPAFLGSFLILTILATLIVAAKHKSAYLLFFFQIVALFLTGTRGAYLGFFIALALFFFFQGLAPFHPRALSSQRFMKNLGIIFIVVPLVLFIAIQGTATSRFIVSEENLRSVHSRMASFATGLRVFAQKPVLGFGSETFEYVSPNVQSPTSLKFELLSSISDRVHNEFLDLLVSAGIFGLLFYILFLFSIFYKGIRQIKLPEKGTDTVMLSGLLAGLAGYLVSLQFSFSVTATAVLFYIFTALSAVSGKWNFLIPQKKHLWQILIGSCTVLMFMIMVIFGILGNMRYLKADFVYVKNNFEDAVKSWPLEPEYHLAYGNELYMQGSFDSALREAEMAHSLNRFAAKPFALAGNIFTQLGRKSKENFSFANESFKIAIELHPYDKNTILDSMNSLMTQGRYEDAIFRGEPLAVYAVYAEGERARIFFKDNPEFLELFENLVLASQKIGDIGREKFYLEMLKKFRERVL